SIRRCSPAGAARRRWSGRSWPAMPRRACRSCASPRGSTAGPAACARPGGPAPLRRAEPIHPDDTYGTLAPRLARLGGELLVRALDEWPLPLEEQDDDAATYAEKIQ